MICVLSQFFTFYKVTENSHQVYFWKFLGCRDPHHANMLIKLPGLFETTSRIADEQLEIHA